MMVFQRSFRISTRGHCDVIEVTPQVEETVAASGITTGLANVSGKGSTLGITTMEYEPGCVADFKRALEIIAPSNTNYAHNARWGDRNGYSHLRSALLGTAKSFPVTGKRLHLGTWQQVVVCDFDDGPREREITVTVCGE